MYNQQASKMHHNSETYEVVVPLATGQEGDDLNSVRADAPQSDYPLTMFVLDVFSSEKGWIPSQ